MTSGSPRYRVVRRVFATSQIAMALILVAFIAGSLLFTGGQVGPLQDAPWDQVWSWPVFPVPAWLLIVLAAVGAAAVIPLCLLTAVAQTPHLFTAIGQAFAGIVAGLLFAGMFPVSDGLIPMPGDSTEYLGLHWVAAALSAFSIVVLIIAVSLKAGRYERMRKSGNLVP